MSKYSAIPITRKKWRRPAEVDFRVDIDPANSATFSGPYARVLANMYCDAMVLMDKVADCALAIPAGATSGEAMVTLQDFMFQQVLAIQAPEQVVS
jgi:hypothetical protein